MAIWSITQYAGLDPARFFPEQREIYLRHLMIVAAHTLSSPIALLLGPLQFHAGLRARLPRLHRACGITYLGAVFLGGLSAIPLTSIAYGYWTTRVGFALLAVLWLGTAAMALSCAVRRDYVTHRRWAIRNFSLTLAAVTLRLWVAGLTSLTETDFDLAYAAAAWCSWVPNLAVAEWLLQDESRSQRNTPLPKSPINPTMIR
ncbi:MAG TPA: DUF2306 domain-containing protein [Steroidobacteraceae bacterium]|nr:DUF2306 domain-containing protein [Steroidobacteraceae bacterium]